MTLYALDAIDDAVGSTRAFLWPFDLGRWARLALVAFFVGGVGGFNPFQFTGSAPSGGGPDAPGPQEMPDVTPSIGGPELAVIAAIAAVVVLIALVFLLVGSIMEFVLVESLRREEVTIRRYWGERWGQGLRLFAFRVLLGLLTLGIAVGIGVVAFAPVLFGSGDVSFGPLLLAIPVLVLVAIASGIVNGFTTVFVVPVMIAEDRALVSAWRRFWPTVSGQWKQYAAYAVMGFVLQIAAGVAAGIAVLVAAIVVAIPLALVGLLGAGLLAASQVAGWAIIAVAAVLFVLAVIALALFVAVPVQTFLRYYALFVLGDTNESFDLISERRRAVRQ